MNNGLFLYLSQTRVFWWLRASLARVSFWIEAKVFGVRYGAKEETTNYQSLRHLFSITQKQLIIALGFAALLQYIDPYLYAYYQKTGISIPDDGDYVTFLATISGIGGVFIGLYYAGISAVGSAIYAKVPNNVRDLLAQERFGNVYMRFLSFLTFLGLILIALRISGLPRVFLAVPFVTLAVGIGIIAFVKLGQRAFYLFDPTALSYHIFDQLQHCLGMVKAGGFRWMDKSFQHHAYRQASTTIDTLETLADITAKEPHLSGKPFIVLSQHLLGFLMDYEYAKRKIPAQSAWYEQQYEHRDWYRTEDSRVAIAHQTGTTLQPDVTNDKEWVEGRVIPILKRCIEVNLAEERYTEVISLFDDLDAYVKRLTQEGAVGRAFALLEDLATAVLNQLAIQPDDGLIKAEVLEKLAVAERIFSLPISVALGYREQLEKLDRQAIEKRISLVRWDNDTSIYRQEFPAYYVSRLEWFRPRLAFEKAVEGHDVTPLWYRTELVCQVEAEQFSDDAKALISKGVAFFGSAISKALSAKRPWLAAAIMSREWEYWHKVGDQLRMWPDKWARLSNDRRIEGLPWSQFDIDSLRSDSEKRRHELLTLMSQQNILLALLSRPEGFPDYAGQFLHTSGEVAFDALLSNNVNLLRSVFEPYLYGCLLRFNSLRPKSVSGDWRVQQELKIAAAALLDVMDVSGYAKLLADFHGNDALWSEVTTVWNKYLAEKLEQSPIPLLAGAVAFTEAAFEIPHRAVLRTTWQQKINWKLADVPRHEVFNRGSLSSDTVIDHDSALVRVFARGPYGSFHDGIDVFIAFYLRTLKEGGDIDFGPKRRDLRQTLEREDRRQRRISDTGEKEQ
ncbi:MAG: hypothetical protein A3F74_07050 [Betaproteobacteria bacterium RIFCSPLOWO2_12_FULL_62_58]|nr:MAG: hypothetical protein A3F74_07050 [Betaproteobacteria bacterium RIFCSPLOWO2_12_FULL_62_58]